MLSAWLSYCSRRLHRGSIRTSLGGRERIVKNRDAALIVAFRRLAPIYYGVFRADVVGFFTHFGAPSVA
jgi:hypothetical protein